MIRLAQLYTGGVGSEIVRRLAAHPQLELVAVLVHADDKAGRDSGELVGAKPNGITTTQSIDDVLAARPDAVIYSGMAWDVPLFERLLRAGVNVYTGLGGYFLPGQPEYAQLQAAGEAGNASLAAGGNIPGLISDSIPLFLSGYTGRIRAIRAWQRNHVSSYPSAVQIQTGLGIGVAPAATETQQIIDNAWVWALGQSANMVATALGIPCTNVVLADKKIALAEEDVVLEGSGYLVKKGTVAGAQWTVVAYSRDQPFLTITNEQTAVLGLGPGWRANHEQPPWTVEIDGEPPIVATFGWPDGVEPGAANSLLNTARAMNVIPRLVAAPPRVRVSTRLPRGRRRRRARPSLTEGSAAMTTQTEMLVEPRLFIAGELRDATGGRTYDVINPATEEIIGGAADATAEDMLEAMAAARTAFDHGDWAADPHFRARCLRQLHAALLANAPAIRETVRAEVGATDAGLNTALFDRALDNLTYAADLAESYEFVQDLGTGESMGMMSRRTLRREPVGVTACITPWNAPMQVNLAKAAFALAAGCTVILKPAPDTPWSATVLGRLAAEATDLPPGVFNVVPTSDNAVAQLLAEDPRVDLISFTGSTVVGRHLMAVAAQTVKKVFLELGGKSAWIVCDDADLDANAMMVSFQALAQAGQGCSINTRILVQRPVYETMVGKLADAYRAMPYGDPNDPAVYMGPLINARQHKRVLDYIEIGKAEGARLVTGGKRPDHLPRGYYVEPTIFADVDPDSRIAQEEIFGPVVCVIPFDTDDDAVRIANSTIYGLAGSVESGNLERARAIADRIRSGVVNVNGGMYYNCAVPFGGYKQSGIGREMGTLGLEEYTEVKVISEGVK